MAAGALGGDGGLIALWTAKATSPSPGSQGMKRAWLATDQRGRRGCSDGDILITLSTLPVE